MRLSGFSAELAVVLVLTAARVHVAQAQTGIDPDRLASVRARLSQVNKVIDTFPEAQKQTLSSGAQNLLTLAQGWNRIEEGLGRAALG